MKKLLLSVLSIGTFYAANAQCTPVDCNAALIAEGITYGGTCDSTIMDGVVGQPYNDFESFVITDNCFNAQIIDPGQPNIDIKITNVDNLSYSAMPAGISAQANASSYTPPGGGYITGCVSYTGTPTEVGIFGDTIHLVADVEVCGFIPVPMNDNPATYRVWHKIKPDPSFTLNSSYCDTDGPVTLTADVTTGGTFTIDGAVATSFDPSTLGAGTYTVKYVVSKMEGAALFPASDSLSMVVSVVTSGATVYLDSDNDGYGDAAVSQVIVGCSVPANYVQNADDCNDSDEDINPDATDIPGNGIDEDCSGSDAVAGIDEKSGITFGLYPNPANESITLINVLSESAQLMDVNGKVLDSKNTNAAKEVYFNVSSLQQGVYFVQANGQTIRFIKN